MFTKKTDLSKLIELKHLDIQTTVANVVKNKEGVITQAQVQAQVTLFENNENGEARVVKKVSTFAIDSNLEAAQDKALVNAQTLLGV